MARKKHTSLVLETYPAYRWSQLDGEVYAILYLADEGHSHIIERKMHWAMWQPLTTGRVGGGSNDLALTILDDYFFRKYGDSPRKKSLNNGHALAQAFNLAEQFALQVLTTATRGINAVTVQEIDNWVELYESKGQTGTPPFAGQNLGIGKDDPGKGEAVLAAVVDTLGIRRTKLVDAIIDSALQDALIVHGTDADAQTIIDSAVESIKNLLTEMGGATSDDPTIARMADEALAEHAAGKTLPLTATEEADEKGFSTGVNSTILEDDDDGADEDHKAWLEAAERRDYEEHQADKAAAAASIGEIPVWKRVEHWTRGELVTSLPLNRPMTDEELEAFKRAYPDVELPVLVHDQPSAFERIPAPRTEAYEDAQPEWNPREGDSVMAVVSIERNGLLIQAGVAGEVNSEMDDDAIFPVSFTGAEKEVYVTKGEVHFIESALDAEVDEAKRQAGLGPAEDFTDG